MKILLTVFLFLICSFSYAAEYSPLPDSVRIGKSPKADVPFDLESLKKLWSQRIRNIIKNGLLPVIDIESSER